MRAIESDAPVRRGGRISLALSLAVLIAALVATQSPARARGAPEKTLIRHVVIEAATDTTPRSDTASVAELSDGRLMVVYHKYQQGKHGGRDYGLCNIWSKVSSDAGVTWCKPRMLVDVATGDMNVQAPALLRLKSGKVLLICLRAHKGGASSTMCAFSSKDDGKTFSALDPVWKRSKGQLLQGGASSLLELKSGRLVLPFHGGGGNQWRQINSAWCFLSDDSGKTWRRSTPVKLPKRGAMEASVAQLADGKLLMSLRTQLGGPYLARSADEGKTWSKAVFSGLEGGESCSCLRRIPGTKDIVLFWNNSRYNPKHHHYGQRTPLTAAFSSDNGKSWHTIRNIADEPAAEYSNLDCFFTSKGDAILTYMYAKKTWSRKQIHLKAALIDRKWFTGKQNPDDSGQERFTNGSQFFPDPLARYTWPGGQSFCCTQLPYNKLPSPRLGYVRFVHCHRGCHTCDRCDMLDLLSILASAGLWPVCCRLVT